MDESFTRQVRPARRARRRRRSLCSSAARRAQGCCTAGARSEVADAEFSRDRIVRDFLSHQHEPAAKHSDVETKMTRVSILDFFLLREQIEEQRGEAGVAQDFGYGLIARAAPAAPAAMGKENEAARFFRNLQVAG